ncbi:hypothetical protein EDD16DRAFT_1775631 [Pisolithus croceorrhizus]|nr:hypothetical protein EV401DRAFT_1965724 [Pisolithus croceorrhizus]KAI6132162.1 hypothetical protein EDD16DRAFT_1775631 [Pisolithus croceorrhizus]
MSDSELEYEVESVTRARVHDKRGKKLIWRYYVKWKGYGWDECTWEPIEHFTDGAEKIIDNFWECVNVGGRDIQDATAFKKGEEILVSGPPKKSGLKRKQSTSSVKRASPPKQRNTISTPITTPRKRRRVQKPYDDVLENIQPRRQARTPRSQRKTSSRKSLQNAKRRRASSPGPRRIVFTGSASSTDSELDAEGEIDPDFDLETREVEDVLMQSSGEDGDDRPLGESLPNSSAVKTSPAFDDLEHFYSGQPIDVEQADPDEGDASPSQQVVSTAPSSPDPLFDSPPSSVGSARQGSRESSTPFHRARAANPLVKLIDAPPPQTSARAITAKARLMSMPTTNSSGAGPTRMVAKRGGKPGPGRSSAGLLTANRSSLLTASKGKLTTVKGRFAPINATREWPENSAATVPKRGNGDPDAVVTLSDDDVVEVDGEGNALVTSIDPKPSGSDLLKLAGVGEDATALPDFDETDPPVERSINGSSNQPPSETMKVEGQDDGVKIETVETQEASCVPTTEPGHTNVSVLAEDIAKKNNLAMVKELLFPSTQLIAPAFGEGSTSLRSTIFGPLYQGATPNPPSHNGATEKEASMSLKITLNDTLSIPITLRDATFKKGGMGDLRIGKSANGRAGNFYGQNDALAIVNALQSHGVARVAPDPSADTQQQEQFTSILRHFESNRTFISAVGVEVFVLYSSENVAIAEKLSTPTHLVGLSSTLLVSRASIENFSTYAEAAYAAQSTES